MCVSFSWKGREEDQQIVRPLDFDDVGQVEERFFGDVDDFKRIVQTRSAKTHSSQLLHGVVNRLARLREFQAHEVELEMVIAKEDARLLHVVAKGRSVSDGR